MLCTWRPPWRRVSLHICLRFVCRMCLFVFSWALTSTVKYPLSCPTFTYLKLSMYKWTLVYPFKSFFRIIQGGTQLDCLQPLFGCSIVPLWIYFFFINFTYHKCKLTVSVLHGCRTNILHFSLIFKDEGTAGPKHPRLVSPDLFLAGCRKQCWWQAAGC